MVFGNGVKNIQAAAYNGARTVFKTAKQDLIVRQATFIQRGRRSLALILEAMEYSVLT